ncbi:MAG: response regulator, partial [Hyphomicrobium sp.]
MRTFNKVLVIDDDPILRALAKEYFESRGTKEVLQAANGLEALDVLQQRDIGIGLILSDLNMPQLDGVEFLGRVKDLDYDGPIVIISGTYDVVIK